MRTEKFKDLFDFAPKSKVTAGDGLDEGNFPFYTSSSVLKKRINKAQHFDEALIFGTGGSASVHFAGEPFATSTDCLVAITKREEINTKFIYYYLFGNIHLLEQGFKGAGLKHISPKYIDNLDIPIFPIETQNKIVSVLDKATSLVKHREKTIELLDALLKATFFDMFDVMLKKDNDQLQLLGEWSDVQGGLQITPKRNSNPIEMPYLRVANVFRGYLDLNEIKTIRVTDAEVERTLLKKGDILVVEGHGNINEIGRAALWNAEFDEMLHQNHIIRIRIKSNKLSPIFLTEYLNSYLGIHQMKSIANTTSGLNTISTGKVKAISIPIPEIDLQKRFEKIYRQIQEKKKVLINSRIQLSNLSLSLSQRAFNGQLNFNIDFELDALIKEIDLQKRENDLSKIGGDIAYLQRLVDKLNAQEFKEKDLYDKAKHVAFQLMTVKEEKRRVTQEYNEKTESIELTLK